MRYLILLGLLVVFTLQAEHVRWQGDYEKARVEALKEKKHLLVLLIEDECINCMKVLERTFKDQPYIEYINKKYVSVLVKKGQTASYPIELLYTLEYPSVFFLDSHEIFERDPVRGYIDPDAFHKHLRLP